MPLEPLSYREVARRLRAAGFAEVSQRHSHVKFVGRDRGGVRVVIVPRHREVAVGTLRSVLRQAGLDVEQFARL